MGRSHSFQFALSDPPLSQEESQRVSIVASDPQLIESLRSMCVNEGYEARHSSPDSIFKETGFFSDLVLLILDDPEWAMELLGEIRSSEVYSHVAVMAVTPHPGQPEEAAACLLAGADEIVAAVKAIAPTFGGINLEDKRKS